MNEELKARLRESMRASDLTNEAAEAIEELERQLADRDAEIAKLIEAVADHVTVRAEQYAELQKYRDAPVVANRHLMDDGWEYFDAPTGDDCEGCQPLIVKPGE